MTTDIYSFKTKKHSLLNNSDKIDIKFIYNNKKIDKTLFDFSIQLYTKLQPKTIFRYLNIIKKFLNYLHNKNIHYLEIDSIEYKKWRTELLSSKIKIMTVNQTNGIILIFYNFLRDEKKQFDFIFFESLKTSYFNKRKYTEENNVKKIIEITNLHYFDKIEDEKFNLLIFMIKNTGLRIEEALNVKFSNIKVDFKRFQEAIDLGIDYKEGYLEITRDMTKSDSGVRNVALKDIVVKRFLEYRKNNLHLKSYLFYADRDISKPVSYQVIYNKLQRFNKKNNIESNFHQFRHFYGSELYKLGTDIKDIQYQMGHKNYETTLNTYIHLSKEESKNNVLNSKTTHREYEESKYKSNQNEIEHIEQSEQEFDYIDD